MVRQQWSGVGPGSARKIAQPGRRAVDKVMMLATTARAVRTRLHRALVFGVMWSVAGPGSSAASAGGKMVDGVVALPGIGPAKAVGIVAYRTRRPFRTVDELVRVKGIGRRMVQAMRSHLAVAGPSTARALLSLPGSAAGSGGAPPPPPPPPPSRGPAPLCRAPPLPPPPAAVARAMRAVQARSIRVIANHCLPPA